MGAEVGDEQLHGTLPPAYQRQRPPALGDVAAQPIDRAMRGEKSPTPIYEGEDSVIAWMLSGPEAESGSRSPEPSRAARIVP